VKTAKKNIIEIVGIFGVLLSLVFVGLELRDANVQAKAAAYQAIGIATSEYHQTMDDRLNLLFEQAFDPNLLSAWSFSDWLAVDRRLRADLRLYETILLQVEQGLLEESAVENLGFASFSKNWLSIPGAVCLWPRVSEGPGKIGPLARARIEAGSPREGRTPCPVDFLSIRRAGLRAE